MKDKRHKQSEARPETPPAADAPPAGPAAPPAPTEAEQLKDRLLHLQADFENFRKRTQRDRADFCQRATEDLLRELLPVLDHFELGLRTAEEHRVDPTVNAGLRMVYDQLLGVLRKAGIEPIETQGQPFDPHVHEAVTTVPSEEYPAGAILAETRRGYRLGHRVLRHAQLVVSRGPPPAAPAPPPEDVPGEEG